MRSVVTFLLLTLLLFSGCNPEKKTRKKITGLEDSPGSRKYEIGMACMEYILKNGDDLSYSKALVKKLLEIGFPAESIYACEWLMQEYPDDADLFYLRGVAYRDQNQYDLALRDFDRALEMEANNKMFLSEAKKTAEEQQLWLDIQSLDTALSNPADSFAVLLTRAEYFFKLKEYDAVLFDLGSLSKMRSPEDSLYYIRKVSSLKKDSRQPVETLSGMLAYFRGTTSGKFRNFPEVVPRTPESQSPGKPKTNRPRQNTP